MIYVATDRPPHPNGKRHKLKTVAWHEEDFSYDVLPPTITSLWQVDCVHTKDEAIAAVIEKAAGKSVVVRRLIPKEAANA